MKVQNPRNQVKNTIEIFNKLTQAKKEKKKIQSKVDKTLHLNINRKKMNKNGNG